MNVVSRLLVLNVLCKLEEQGTRYNIEPYEEGQILIRFDLNDAITVEYSDWVKIPDSHVIALLDGKATEYEYLAQLIRSTLQQISKEGGQDGGEEPQHGDR